MEEFTESEANMNREQIFNEFAKNAEADDKYYNFGKHGIIEDVLSWFDLPSKKFQGANSVIHADNLETLHDFLINAASEDQLRMINDLSKGRKLPEKSPLADSSEKVFVSMPMSPGKCALVEDIRKGISAALSETGNDPYFLDRDVYNENMYSKMIDEITACKFLVADLTSQNQGVYFEVGYAKALGKTVILTCQEDELEEVHFDLRQTQIVLWRDADDLQMKLADHIRRS